MPQTLKCPSCNAPLQYDGRSSSIKCDFCNNVTLIPEEFRQSEPAGQKNPFGSDNPFGVLSQSLPLKKLAEINDYLQRGQKINAIKVYRETFNVGLKEAKEAVERLERGESLNLGGQQVTAFHDTAHQDQMVVNVGAAGNVRPGGVPGQVVLGGSRPYQSQNAGCVGPFLGQFGCLLFLFFWIPFLIVMVGTLIFPDMVLWAAPLVCEQGYEDAYSERVGYYSTGNFEGNNIVLLHCVDAAGNDVIPHPLQVDAIIFAGPMAVLAVVAFGIAFFGRIKALASI